VIVVMSPKNPWHDTAVHCVSDALRRRSGIALPSVPRSRCCSSHARRPSPTSPSSPVRSRTTSRPIPARRSSWSSAPTRRCRRIGWRSRDCTPRPASSSTGSWASVTMRSRSSWARHGDGQVREPAPRLPRRARGTGHLPRLRGLRRRVAPAGRI